MAKSFLYSEGGASGWTHGSFLALDLLDYDSDSDGFSRVGGTTSVELLSITECSWDHFPWRYICFLWDNIVVRKILLLPFGH